jgi:hypothetical protein
MTLDVTQVKDARIAEYTFGRTIIKDGINVFSCADAHDGKRIFGNDPDPLKEIVLDSQTELVVEWINEHPGGIVDQQQEFIFSLGDTLQVHHRTVMFGSTWRSDSLKPANKSFVYHAGAFTHFRFPGLARMTSLQDKGVVACSGFESRAATNRKIFQVDGSLRFTPTSVGSILIPMFDGWYHRTKMTQHFPFLVTEPDEITITMDTPGIVIEFTQEEPDVARFSREWLNQVETGLIEIADRTYG